MTTKTIAPSPETTAPSPEALALARRLEQACELAGLSPSAAALTAGLARGSLTNTLRLLRSGEKGTATIDTVDRLARATGVDPAWLMTGAGVPRPEAREGVPTQQHPDWPVVAEALQRQHRELPPLAFDAVGEKVLCDPSEPLDSDLLLDLARAWYRRSSREALMDAERRAVAKPKL